MLRRIDLELGAEAADAVFQRGDRQVVPCAEVLDVHPARPAGGVDALLAAGLELAGGNGKFLPGLRCRIRIEPGFLVGVLIDVEHRRRGIEREGQHVAFAVGVVTGHRAHVGFGVELLARILHQLVDRHDRALGTHHGCRPDLEHLNDVGRLAGSEGGDRRRHGFAITALVDGHHLVVLLAGIKTAGHGIDAVAVRAGHRVPPLDFGLRLRRKREEGRNCGGCYLDFHLVSLIEGLAYPGHMTE